MKTQYSRTGLRGVATVEFALVAVAFVTLIMGIVEFGRWISMLELVSETTRLGARMAVVCDLDDSTIKTRMRAYLPMLDLANSNISIDYLPADCDKTNCQTVTVGLTGAGFTPHIPLLAQLFPVPSFTTSLPRESMESTSSDGYKNPVCL